MSTEANIGIEHGFFRGEDKALVFTIVNQTDMTTPINITGWTTTFRMATQKWGAAVITKTPSLTTPASGILTVNLASADTAGLSNEGNNTIYYYDLRRTDSGARAELGYGTITVIDTFTDS